ncbi:von Willebrand factor type A domain-containing protein [Reticulomyxa filosa]|uniref:von Willebrand factor type A domain-containing protein n=1 Tax=Reticulomyxa filosa TaxID=46433 RepID=X6NQN5_RETFI|nr:von Willebrand factor type A domain-containing protein [Reticulomyxa filosa]|eukprot:ETO28605.1 von Willebrand factor type A domain-containing protein [Reticulomyxa filosa]
MYLKSLVIDKGSSKSLSFRSRDIVGFDIFGGIHKQKLLKSVSCFVAYFVFVFFKKKSLGNTVEKIEKTIKSSNKYNLKLNKRFYNLFATQRANILFIITKSEVVPFYLMIEMDCSGSFGTSLHKSKDINALSVHDFEHEGIFGRYFFDTYPTGTNVVQGEQSTEEKKEQDVRHEQLKKEAEQDFLAVRTNYARSRDPVSNEMQEWLGIGTHSKYDGKKGIAKHGRPSVSLVVALDVSGSMDCGIASSSEGETSYTSKLDVAKYSLVSMLKNLKDNDSLGIVTFDEECHVIYPLTPWKQSSAEELKGKIMSLQTSGGTDLSVAFRGASQLLEQQLQADKKKVTQGIRTEYRILFMTDMQPNTGETSEKGLFGMANRCSQQRIYTTFVGIGEDFGSELAQFISTNLKGGQYMTVRTAKEFEDLMTENFDYSIFPTIFDFKFFFFFFFWEGACKRKRFYTYIQKKISFFFLKGLKS